MVISERGYKEMENRDIVKAVQLANKLSSGIKGEQYNKTLNEFEKLRDKILVNIDDKIQSLRGELKLLNSFKRKYVNRNEI